MNCRGWVVSGYLIGAMLTLLWPSAAQAQQGVSANEIVIGGFGAITGPVAYLGIGARAGLELAVSEINQHGGINGRKIRLVFEASGSDPAEFLASAKKLTESERVFAIIMASGSIGAAASADYIREKGIPTLNIIAAAPKIHFPLSPNIFHTTSGPAQAWAQYTVDQLLTLKPQPKKVAMVFQTISYHKAIAEQLRPLLQKAGVEVVSYEEFAAGDRDFSGQLVAMRRARPDAVLAFGEGPPTAFLMKQAVETMGMKNLQWIVSNSCITPEFPKIGGSAVEGARATWQFLQYHGEKRGDMPKWEANWKKLNPNAPVGRPNYMDMSGYTGMYILALALREAGKDPTWKSVQAALESMKDAAPSKFGKWASDLEPPYTFGPDDHQGNDRVFEVRVTRGEWRVDPDRVFFNNVKPPSMM